MAKHTPKAVVTLADICKQAKVAPKLARRRLRNSEKTPEPIADARWTWPVAAAKQVKQIIAA
jgi:hypothetical protein